MAPGDLSDKPAYSRSFARVPEPFGGEDEKQRPGTSRRTITITNARPPINHDHATVPAKDPLYPLVLQSSHALTGELKRALTEQGRLRASRSASPANLVRPGLLLSRLPAPRTRTNLFVIPAVTNRGAGIRREELGSTTDSGAARLRRSS